MFHRAHISRSYFFQKHCKPPPSKANSLLLYSGISEEQFGISRCLPKRFRLTSTVILKLFIPFGLGLLHWFFSTVMKVNQYMLQVESIPVDEYSQSLQQKLESIRRKLYRCEPLPLNCPEINIPFMQPLLNILSSGHSPFDDTGNDTVWATEVGKFFWGFWDSAYIVSLRRLRFG